MKGVFRPPAMGRGSVSGPTVFKSSKIEPGQPWVMIGGMASDDGERI